MKLHEYPDRELMHLSVADRITSQLADFLRRGEGATLAVPGGETPGPVFDILSGADLDWGRVTVMPTDERWAPPGVEPANQRLLRERLLTGRAEAAHAFPLSVPEANGPEAAASTLCTRVAALLPISVLILGMGLDGHVASLLVGGDHLGEALGPDAPAVMAMRSDAAAETRLTLSLPALRSAFNMHLVIAGKAKRETLERAARKPVEEAPVRAILDLATIHWAE